MARDVVPHLGLMSPTARHVAILGLLILIFVVVGIVKDTKPVVAEISRIKESMDASEYSYEVIAVDDGSTDETPEILAEYAVKP